MKRGAWALLGAVVVTVAVILGWRATRRRGPEPVLRAIGPKTVSNQTGSPISLYGDGFRPGLRIHFGSPVNRDVHAEVVDSHRAFARLPPDVALPESVTQLAVPVSIDSAHGSVPLTIVNDTAFPDLVALAVSATGRVLAISDTTDTIFSVDPKSGVVASARTGDGPTALLALPDGRIAVAHRYSPEVWVFGAELAGTPLKVSAPANASALAVSPDGATLYVAEQARDSVVAIDLATGHRRWRTRVDPNPGTLVVAGKQLAVGSEGAGTVQLLDASTGALRGSIQPGPDVQIVGGRTAPYAKYVIGGKAIRGLVWSAALDRLFTTSIGPNVGPNPARMEVSMNPGVGVIDPTHAHFDRHLGFGDGLDEGLAIDDARGLLFVADTGLGRVRVIDARTLSTGEQVAAAELASFAIPALDGTPRLARQLSGPERRPSSPAHDIGVAAKRSVLPARGAQPAVQPAGVSESGYAGDELHSGPFALALAGDGRTLFVLDRFSGTLAVVDVADVRHASVTRQIPIIRAWTQPTRRLGQILYYADPAHTGITCDGCHLEGHGEGVFFAKTHPLRVYRAPSLRGVKDTPPYFTPASTHSLAETSKMVGERNRLFREVMTPSEIDALTTFSGAITLLPNPNRDADGAPPERLELPWGGEGAPRHGAELFGASGCASCHPAPLYTSDQDGATRGRYLDVGTPHALPIRPQWQDSSNGNFGVPSLLGSWDVFPMLTSGAGGLRVDADLVRVDTADPVRTVLEHEPGPHDTSKLTAAERNDLYAFLLSL